LFAGVPVLAAWLLLSATALADFKDGERAFDAGDYAAAIVEWRPLAADGDARAQTNLGHLYRLGQGVERDYGEALKWYRLAADQGSTRAQANHGNMYIEGLGVEADPIAGVALFRQAAESGFSVAQLYLGDFYRLGEVVVLDPEQAALWYRRAAKQGHPEASLRLGQLYLSGSGVEIDEAKAALALREAAAFGLAAAQYELAELYRRGRGVEVDLKEAMRWYHAAAGQGHVSAVERLAAGGGKAADDPHHQLRVSAAVGDAAAQMRLATLLREGDEMPRDPAAALEWYRRAAAQGHARASYNLGLMSHDGDGVETDDIMAAAWFRRAAGLGESDAQYTLGVFLSKGIGGEADPSAARDWFSRAANQGDSRAQYSLGLMHEKGAGGAVDRVAALKWYSAAAAQGDLRAHERFAALTVETTVTAAPPADVVPIDAQTEEALAASAAAGLDDLDRVDEAADTPSDELATVEPEPKMESVPVSEAEEVETVEEAMLEPEDSEPEDSETVDSAPAETETVTVVVTTGTGVAKRVESLNHSEAVDSEAPAIEFSLFGGDDEIEADETPEEPEEPEENIAVEEVEAVSDPVVETPPEAAKPEAVATSSAFASTRRESVQSEAPVISSNWLIDDEQTEGGETLPEENVAVQEVEETNFESAMTPEPAADAGDDALVEATPEMAPETPQEDTALVIRAITIYSDEAVESEAPVIDTGWFNTTSEPEEPVEQAAPQPAAADTALLDESDDEALAKTDNEHAVPVLEAEITAKPSDDPVFAYADAPASFLIGSEVNSLIPAVKYDLFDPKMGRIPPSDGDLVITP
jgi:TPR repeat protein